MQITIGQAFRTGFAQTRSLRKIVWLTYAVNLLAAIAIALPLIMTGAAFLGQSLENQRLFDNFDVSWMAEFGYSGQYQQFVAWTPAAALIATAFLFLTTFLSGGTLALLENPSDSFFGNCARWFPPFFRLMLISLLFCGIAFAIRSLVSRALRKLFPDEMSGKPAALEHFFGFLLLVAMVCFVNLIFDYAKIQMVTGRHRKAWRATREALRFVFRHFTAAAGLYALLFFCGLLMLAVYHVWSEVIGQSSGFAVFVLLIFRQVYLYFRMKLRIAFLASQRALFQSIQ